MVARLQYLRLCLTCIHVNVVFVIRCFVQFVQCSEFKSG